MGSVNGVGLLDCFLIELQVVELENVCIKKWCLLLSFLTFCKRF